MAPASALPAFSHDITPQSNDHLTSVLADTPAAAELPADQLSDALPVESESAEAAEAADPTAAVVLDSLLTESDASSQATSAVPQHINTTSNEEEASWGI